MLTPDIIKCAIQATKREYPGVRFFVVFHEGLVYVVDAFRECAVTAFPDSAQASAGQLIQQLEEQRAINNN